MLISSRTLQVLKYDNVINKRNISIRSNFRVKKHGPYKYSSVSTIHDHRLDDRGSIPGRGKGFFL
jgi:hypothetical protein